MKLQINLEEKESSVSLDRIVDMVLDNIEVGQQFAFKCHEQKFMDEIRKYTHDIRVLEFGNMSRQEQDEVVESQSSDLHETMSGACIACLKHGMKLGAELILELLH